MGHRLNFRVGAAAGHGAGALVCLLRTHKSALPRRFAQGYIAVLRGTPVLMLLLLLFYGVLAQYGFSPVTVAIITFGLNVSAHVAELLRAAREASDRGQAEAARTLSQTAREAFRWVTLPQMLRPARPVFQSTVVNLIQWTSVVGYIIITDLTRVINNIASRTVQPLLTTVIGMLIYLGLSYHKKLHLEGHPQGPGRHRTLLQRLHRAGREEIR